MILRPATYIAPSSTRKGEDLGGIADLLIDAQTMQVTQVVLSLNEAIFEVDRLHAIQLSDLDPNFEEERFVYPLDRIALKKLPSFTEDEWTTGQVSVDMEEFETVD